METTKSNRIIQNAYLDLQHSLPEKVTDIYFAFHTHTMLRNHFSCGKPSQKNDQTYLRGSVISFK